MTITRPEWPIPRPNVESTKTINDSKDIALAAETTGHKKSTNTVGHIFSKS
jgi:hypothetical protein